MKRKIILNGVFVIIAFLISLINYVIKLNGITYLKNIIRYLPLIGAAFFITGIITFITKKERTLLSLSILFILFLISSNILSSHVSNMQDKKVFNDGNHIVQALENYFIDNNQYPEKLDELVPKYIKNIPKIKTTNSEVDFNYFTKDSGNSYYLGFMQYYFDGVGWVEEP